MSEDPVGSDSFGQCYCTRYHGIDVMPKNCLTITPEKKKERAKKSVIDEAGIISSLPDNKRLPVLFGVITEKEPICLVTQFYGVGGKSVTHQAANTSGMLTSQDCIDLFTEICSALHVHS